MFTAILVVFVTRCCFRHTVCTIPIDLSLVKMCRHQHIRLFMTLFVMRTCAGRPRVHVDLATIHWLIQGCADDIVCVEKYQTHKHNASCIDECHCQKTLKISSMLCSLRILCLYITILIKNLDIDTKSQGSCMRIPRQFLGNSYVIPG